MAIHPCSGEITIDPWIIEEINMEEQQNVPGGTIASAIAAQTEAEKPPDPKCYLDIEDGYISVKAPYSVYANMVYKHNGGHFKSDDDGKRWLLPMTLEVCQELRRYWKQDLVISKTLNTWAKEAKANEVKVAEFHKAMSAELTTVSRTHPALAEAMKARTYQQVGAAFIAHQKSVLIADEPGLGKTLEAIAGLVEANCWRGLILVAAPLTSLRTVWERELSKWAPEAHVVIGVPKKYDNAAARIDLQNKFIEHYAENPLQPHVLVVNPEMLQGRKQDNFTLFRAVTWQGIVVDESHKYLAGIESARKHTQTGKGLLDLTLADDGVKVALSGTPMRGRPSNLWGTLHWLRPKVYSAAWRWYERYFNMSSGWGGSKQIGSLNPYREAELYKSLDDIMLRRTKAEVVKELPAKQHIDVMVDMTDSQETMYNAMAADAAAELLAMDFGDVDEAGRISAVGVLAIMTRLKQFADCAWRGANIEGMIPTAKMHPLHSGKTAVIEDMLIERGIAGPMNERDGDHKIVIASQFTRVIDSLEEYLTSINVESLKITGGVKERDRVSNTEQFQAAGGPRVMLMNTKAGGVSITLDAYCDELVIIDETWTPDDQEQLEDRIHRVSRIHQVTIYRLLTKGSIDEYIADITARKDSVQKMVLDGRRGVENIAAALVR
jgi:SNF2 family DNA or RNA helicase